MTLGPRAILVHRRSEYDELVARHGTARQVEFFLAQRGRSFAEVRERDERLRDAVRRGAAAVPSTWRRGEVERADLSRFAFAPEDVVLVVGQDGLVANVAKYVAGQPVVGFDPEPGVNPGVRLTAGYALNGRWSVEGNVLYFDSRSTRNGVSSSARVRRCA